MKFISKKFIVFILVFCVFSGLFLITATNAHAGVFPSASDIATFIPKVIFQTLLGIAQFFTGLCGKLFTAISEFGFKNMETVHMGWTITRNIVNMFFIFALVIIAFATILRIDSYGIKALLPKLILMAILINFSFLACGIIIDASNIAAQFFRDGIKTDDIGQTIIDATGSAKSLQVDPKEGVGMVETKSDLDRNIRQLISLAFAITIVGITGIILLIGSVLFVIRIGALWVLIILAPIAWFLSIFPAFKAQANKWWSNFLKWSFFAPIFLFFIYLSIALSNEISRPKYSTEAFKELNSVILGSAILDNLFSYIVIIILLLGAPIIALQMGVYGATTTIGFAKGQYVRARKGITKWAGTKTEAGARRLVKPEKVSSFFAQPAVSWIPGMKAIGRAATGWAAKGTTRINEEAKKMPTLSEKDTLKRYNLATHPYQKMAWLQKLSEVAKEPANLELIKRKLKKYEALGGNATKDIVANDLTLARDDKELAAAANIRQTTGKTILKANEAKDAKSVEAMRIALGTSQFVSAVDKMPEKIKEAIADTLINSANASSTPFSGLALERRNAFAKLTHKTAEAFMDRNKAVHQEHVKNFVYKMKPVDFGKVTGDINIKTVGQYVDTQTALAIKKHLSRDTAAKMAPAFSPGVQRILKKKPAWAPYIPYIKPLKRKKA